jgi:hypothetical protein
MWRALRGGAWPPINGRPSEPLRSSARPAPLAGRIVTTLPMWYCGLVRGDEAYDVFLSYSRADSDAAETLRARLKEAGLNAFLDLCDCSAKAWALP